MYAWNPGHGWNSKLSQTQFLDGEVLQDKCKQAADVFSRVIFL